MTMLERIIECATKTGANILTDIDIIGGRLYLNANY